MTPAHGKRRRYGQGCRCDLCRKWKSDTDRKRRVSKAIKEGKSIPGTHRSGWRALPTKSQAQSQAKAKRKEPQHGKRRRYDAGCRCDICRKWKSDTNSKRRAARALREGKSVPTKHRRGWRARTRPKTATTTAKVATTIVKSRPPKMFGSKTCVRCRIPKHVYGFPIDPRCDDGLSAICSECVAQAKPVKVTRA